MKRKLFFLLERLEIKRSERIAMSLSMIFFVLTSGYFALAQPGAGYDPDYYNDLERIFEERSQLMQAEKNILLSRYEPDVQTGSHEGTQAAIQPAALADSTSQEHTVFAASMININTANAEKLQELPGIGPAYSLRIIEWREENGMFTSKEQLLEIKGIGERRLENMLPLIEL